MLEKLKAHRKRILIASTVLVIILQAVVFIVDDYGDLKGEIQTGKKYFELLINERSQKLEQTALLVASDYALKAAVSTFEKDTVRLALLNHEARIGADMMAVTNLDQSFFVSTIDDKVCDILKADLKTIIDDIEKNAKQKSIAIVNTSDNTTYQVVIVPLRAPLTIGYVITGFLVDQRIVESIQDVTALEITLLTRPKETDEPKQCNVAASTSDKTQTPNDLLEKIKNQDKGPASFLSDIVVIKQDNPSIEFLAYIEKPWNELIHKYLISIFYLVFIFVISALRFVLKRADMD